GVVGRVLSAPVTARGLVLGQVLGRFAIAIVQGAWIMLGSSLLFGVDWGDLRLSVAVLALFAMVSAGAAILLGTALDNEGVAAGAAGRDRERARRGVRGAGRHPAARWGAVGRAAGDDRAGGHGPRAGRPGCLGPAAQPRPRHVTLGRAKP